MHSWSVGEAIPLGGHLLGNQCAGAPSAAWLVASRSHLQLGGWAVGASDLVYHSTSCSSIESLSFSRTRVALMVLYRRMWVVMPLSRKRRAISSVACPTLGDGDTPLPDSLQRLCAWWGVPWTCSRGCPPGLFGAWLIYWFVKIDWLKIDENWFISQVFASDTAVPSSRIFETSKAALWMTSWGSTRMLLRGTSLTPAVSSITAYIWLKGS